MSYRLLLRYPYTRERGEIRHFEDHWTQGLISGNIRHHQRNLVRMEVYGDQVINGVENEVQFTLGLLGLVVIFKIPECILEWTSLVIG